MPQEKVELVEELRNSGVVVMVGDGVNDAPAMAVSDVGVAMGAIGSDVAIETADVALMGDDLSKLPTLIDQARRTMRVVRQNVVISILVKLLIGFLAVFGLVSLWFAIAVGDMGLSLVVIMNALKLAAKR
jgi:Cd2+/Zn2+-exporting ATPase